MQISVYKKQDYETKAVLEAFEVPIRAGVAQEQSRHFA